MTTSSAHARCNIVRKAGCRMPPSVGCAGGAATSIACTWLVTRKRVWRLMRVLHGAKRAATHS
eukprot:352805-Chlamydomonas_euryale.AAC.5